MAAHPKPYPALSPRPESSPAKKPRIVAGNAPAKSVAQRTTPREPVAAAKAKAHFLQLLDEVQRDGRPIVITKRGRIVAQLVPASKPQSLSAFDQVFGSMKGRGKITGDIVSPDWESWGPQWR
jgi:prevent-host-death family protein